MQDDFKSFEKEKTFLNKVLKQLVKTKHSIYFRLPPHNLQSPHPPLTKQPQQLGESISANSLTLLYISVNLSLFRISLSSFLDYIIVFSPSGSASD